ncbi:MAG: putative peptidoglycan glycosyltransferase FtsW [Candidatus Dojkabacteria bacterium]|nr:putative peptidoglycan glycosyltransferase FtsW [Candidatus Dojkabacteria bacterium]
MTRRQRFLQRTRTRLFSKGAPDYILLALIVGLVLFGLVMVYDASVIVASETYGDQFRFLKLQAIWVAVGSCAFAFTYLFDYHNYPKLIVPAIITTIILLVLVVIAGPAIFGSRRWFDIGVVNIQPSELAKLTFTVYLACWLARQKQRSGSLKEAFRDHLKTELLPFAFILFAICFLIIIEPDLGTTAVVGFTALAVYFISGTDALHTLGSMFIVAVMGVLGVIAAIISPYRATRVTTFLETIKTGYAPDPWISGYQINQVLIAIGSGGLFGIGFGESRQKFFYLVGNSAFTDTIFAVYAEEFGFLGDLVLVLAFLMFISRGLKIARNAPDRLGSLLATGITVWIGLQAFLNIAANIALGPLTGIPLPFFSYGGSSMVVILAGVGILLNVSKSTSHVN